MSKGKSDKIKYKPYNQDQLILFPHTFDDLIPKDHLVRLVNTKIDDLNIEKEMRKEQVGGGTSRYNPVMMTKLFVYGYMTGVCSSRKLAQALRENIMFMWLAGGQSPDFRTLNRFRGSLLKGVIKDVFLSTLKMLQAEGHINLSHYFIDGTKIESAAGKYTFVWRKSVEKYDRQLDAKLHAYLEMVNDIWDHENAVYGDNDFDELIRKDDFTSEDIEEIITAMKAEISHFEDDDNEVGKKKVKMKETAVRTIERDFLPRKRKYEHSSEILGNRNSYSKTDVDATCMMMKESDKRNPLLRPSYNVQVGTEKGFIVGYDIFQNPGDTLTLKPHLENQEKRLGALPKVVIADAGYGGEENYEYLDNKNIVSVVKYGMFEKESSKNWKEDIWNSDNWPYDEKEKYYQCPNGKRLIYKETQQKKNPSGYLQTSDVYECESCKYCRRKKLCTHSKNNRRILRNENWLRLKKKTKAIFNNEEYKKLYKQRAPEIETVFGQIKGNQKYRRFLLRGKENVYTEWGLLSLGYNLKQLHRIMQ